MTDLKCSPVRVYKPETFPVIVAELGIFCTFVDSALMIRQVMQESTLRDVDCMHVSASSSESGSGR